MRPLAEARPPAAWRRAVFGRAVAQAASSPAVDQSVAGPPGLPAAAIARSRKGSIATRAWVSLPVRAPCVTVAAGLRAVPRACSRSSMTAVPAAAATTHSAHLKHGASIRSVFHARLRFLVGRPCFSWFARTARGASPPAFATLTRIAARTAFATRARLARPVAKEIRPVATAAFAELPAAVLLTASTAASSVARTATGATCRMGQPPARASTRSGCVPRPATSAAHFSLCAELSQEKP
jgi:hypothetical protein